MSTSNGVRQQMYGGAYGGQQQAPAQPMGGARPMGYGNTPYQPKVASSQTMGSGGAPQGIYNPMDKGPATPGPSIMPQGNFAQPGGGLLGNQQYLALSRGDSTDQARLLGLLGGNQEQAHQLNQYTGPGGQGYDPHGYGVNSDQLASGTYGISDLTQGQRDMYQQNGIVSADGKWLKSLNDQGQWVPYGASNTATAIRT